MQLYHFIALIFLQLLSVLPFMEGGYVQVITNGYNHQLVAGLDLSKSNSVTFNVITCRDAIFAMQPSSFTSSAYEIVIGGWDNSNSCIRNGFTASELTNARISNLVSCSESRTFWASWSNGGISVGTGSVVGSSVIMYTPNSPQYAVTGISVASWKGVGASWSFKTGPGEHVDLFTPNWNTYHPVLNYAMNGKTSFTFNVRACNDAHIKLEPPSGSGTWFEIVIGGWGNGKSVIRKNGNDVTYSDGSHLDCNSVRNFWISWGTGGVMMGAGKDVGSVTILNKVDPWAIYQVQSVSVFTAWGSTGNWHFDP